MKLDLALKRAGITIVKQSGGGDHAVVLLRVNADATETWATIVSEFLLAAKKPISVEEWKTEVTRVYFLDQNDQVRYLWRVTLGGSLPAAVEALTMAVTRSVAQTVEVVSSPLHGRLEQDPTSLKGAYSIGGGGASEGHARVAKEMR